MLSAYVFLFKLLLMQYIQFICNVIQIASFVIAIHWMLEGFFFENTAGNHSTSSVSEFIQQISTDLVDNALTPSPLEGEGMHVLGGEKGDLGSVKRAAEIAGLKC